MLSGQRRGGGGRGCGQQSRRAALCNACSPAVPGKEPYLYRGAGGAGGEAAGLVARERRPTNSSSAESQPRPLHRQGEEPILETSFPALAIRGRGEVFLFGLASRS